MQTSLALANGSLPHTRKISNLVRTIYDDLYQLKMVKKFAQLGQKLKAWKDKLLHVIHCPIQCAGYSRQNVTPSGGEGDSAVVMSPTPTKTDKRSSQKGGVGKEPPITLRFHSDARRTS